MTCAGLRLGGGVGSPTVGNLSVKAGKDEIPAPSYAEARAEAEKYARGQSQTISSTIPGGARCAFQDYIAPVMSGN